MTSINARIVNTCGKIPPGFLDLDFEMPGIDEAAGYAAAVGVEAA
jgi:hypothetical protein